MPISLSDTALLVVAGLFGGVLNAVAGGGTFLTFPALVFIGIPRLSIRWPSSSFWRLVKFTGRLL
jgi:uncharacterized membrane protein YfcA